jgi:hypothetical protein
MTTDIKQQQCMHFDAILQNLLKEWDPIGVREIEGAQDEYNRYAGLIYKLLIDRKPELEIFNVLWCLETEHMGLTGNRQATEHFAERLTKLSDEIFDTKM